MTLHRNLIAFLMLLGVVAVQAQGLESSRLLNRNSRGGSSARASRVDSKEEGGASAYEHTNRFLQEDARQNRQLYVADSAYYRSVVKRHGWLVGVGPRLTEWEASHLTCYYKMSKKNQAGNWTLVQAFNGYGQLTTDHNVTNYLVPPDKEDQEGCNPQWVEKIAKVCQWRFLPNASGEQLTEERGLDANGNVIYCYVPVKVGERTYVGSYLDAWGMPIFLRTDSLGNDAGYANFVQITRDSLGYEVLLKFTDRNGFPQCNHVDAYMVRQKFDALGCKVMQESLGITGNRMNDAYGNCGWQAFYNDEGMQLWRCYYDADSVPVRLDVSRRPTNAVIKKVFSYDTYGRNTETRFVDATGERDCDQNRIFRIVDRYNDHGQRLFTEYYDKDTLLVAADSTGVARKIRDYDAQGRLVLWRHLDRNDSIIKHHTYGYTGSKFTSEHRFVTRADTLHQTFSWEVDPQGNVCRRWYDDNFMRIDSVDDRGHSVLQAYYYLDGRPSDSLGYQRHTWNVAYRPHGSTTDERWLMADGSYAAMQKQGFSRQVLDVDSLQRTIKRFQYVADTLVDAREWLEDYRMERDSCTWELTPYGEHARVGWLGKLFYCVYMSNTLYGDASSQLYRNEFDEPAYSTSDTYSQGYHLVMYGQDKRSYTCFDADGSEIPRDSLKSHAEHQARVLCVEVTDTARAYPLGIRNGDIILAYGDWRQPENALSDEGYFHLETFVKARQKKQMALVHHDSRHRRSRLVTVELGEGGLSDFGFYVHSVLYTPREWARIQAVAAENKLQMAAGRPETDHAIELCVPEKGPVASSSAYFKGGLRDAFVPTWVRLQRVDIIPSDYLWCQGVDSAQALQGSVFFHSVNKGTKTISGVTGSGRQLDYTFSGKAGVRFWKLTVPDTLFQQLNGHCRELLAQQSPEQRVYDWRAHSGKLSARQLAEQLKPLSRVTELRRGTEAWKRYIRRNPQYEGFDGFVRCAVNPEHTGTALSLLEQLNKKGYEDIPHETTFQKGTDLVLIRREKGYVVSMIVVFRNRIDVAYGRFAESDFSRLFNDYTDP